MFGKPHVSFVGMIASVLIGCADKPGAPPTIAAPAAEKAEPATATEQALQSALNSERRKAGKPELEMSATLARLAREESNAAAAAGQLPGNDTDRLLMRSGYGSLARVQGTLKDRGAQTGAGFVTHWSTKEREVLLDEWSASGTAISKSADGRLFAVVLLARPTGGSLMEPALDPGGFRKR
jgi:uncharacterized protein YkwD